MRRGWTEWIVGTVLAITAVSFAPAMALAGSTAVPPLPWTFYAIYGTVATATGVVATVLLIRGWTLLHGPPAHPSTG